MRKSIPGLAAAALAIPAAAAPAPDSASEGAAAQVRILNAHSAIREYRMADESTVYFQDHRRNWYRADLDGPCYGLDRARHLPIDGSNGFILDRNAALVVRGSRCPITSLVASGPPPVPPRRWGLP